MEAQKLRTQIAVKVAKMVQMNKTRLSFLEEFQRMIDGYDSGASICCKADGVHEAVRRRQTAISEEMTEEEQLTIFDLPTKPGLVWTKPEEREVKKVAKGLLQKLKSEKLVLDWKKKRSRSVHGRNHTGRATEDVTCRRFV